jgi:hypothetical protein
MHSVSPSEAPPGDLDDKLWVKTGRMVGSSVVAANFLQENVQVRELPLII